MANIIRADFDHYDLNAVDIGDAQHTANKVFNLCFVPAPNDSMAQKYRIVIARASEALAQAGNKTCYTLRELPSPTSVIDSHVHATLSHVVIKDPRRNATATEDLASALEQIIGKVELSLPVIGLTYFCGKPFDRLAKATDGSLARLNSNIEDRVIWGAINLTESFRSTRDEIGNIVSAASKGMAACIGATGDALLPHHTAYVQRTTKAETGHFPSIPWGLNPEPQPVRHVLALGTCGPWGQVTAYVTDPKMVRQFLKQTICRL